LPSVEALPSVFYLALGKAFFAERPKKNARQSLRRSAKKWIPVVMNVCHIIVEAKILIQDKYVLIISVLNVCHKNCSSQNFKSKTNILETALEFSNSNFIAYF
jgi:hypothetical protein